MYTIASFSEIKDLVTFIFTNDTFHYEVPKTLNGYDTDSEYFLALFVLLLFDSL